MTDAAQAREPEMDLQPLVDAAERAGLPGLHARLAPPDRRRGRWFARQGSTLLVNERVVERLTPPEGQALLVNTVLQWKHMSRWRRRVAGQAALTMLLLVAGAAWAPSWLPVGASMLGLVLIAVVFVGWSRAMFAADDESVELIGDPEVLVRALNTIHQDRLDIGSNRVDARPDVHRRAERLVTMHQLRLPPERRTVPVLKATAGCGAGWELSGSAIGPGGPSAAGGGSGSGSGNASGQLSGG